ncbi:MAG: hypothetical protein BWY91_03121 [bacterium ADurb.BinA028]|nr:MAG: hypothetical protein BWY91_03121 [bacterium ADurb.BinA028]
MPSSSAAVWLTCPGSECIRAKITSMTKNATMMPRLTMCRPGSTSGADFIFADNLR